MKVSPGYITIGIIIEDGSEPSSTLPADKLRVRVPEFHGYDPQSSGSSLTSENYTPDIALPEAHLQLSPGQSLKESKSLYKSGSLVYVIYPTGSLSDLLVTGIYLGLNDILSNDVSKNYGPKFLQSLVNLTSGRLPYTSGVSGSFSPKPYDPNNWPSNGNSLWKNKFGIPTQDFAITSPYGKRRSGFHQGIDINWGNDDCINTPVVSASDGTVVQIYRNYPPDSGYIGSTDGKGYGNTVAIRHNFKINGHTCYTRYAHLNSIPDGTVEGVPEIKVGTPVVGSQEGHVGDPTIIGYLGHTGSSTAVHLHFEIILDSEWHKRGTPLNPSLYMFKAEDEEVI